MREKTKRAEKIIICIVDRDYDGLVYEMQSPEFSGMRVGKDRSEFNNIYRHILPRNFGMKANFRSGNERYDVDLQGDKMILVDELNENERRKLDLNGFDFAFIPTPEEMKSFNRKDYHLAYLHCHNCVIPKSRIYPVPLDEEEKSLIIKDIMENFSGKIVIKEPTGYCGNGNTFLKDTNKTQLERTIHCNYSKEKTFVVQEQAHEERKGKNIEEKGYATYRSIIIYSPDLPGGKSLMLGTVNKFITKTGSVDSHESEKIKLYFNRYDLDNDDYELVRKSYKQNKYGTENHTPIVQDNMKKTAEAGYEFYKDVSSLSHEEFLVELSKKGNGIIYENCIIRAGIFTALRNKDFQSVEYLLDSFDVANDSIGKQLLFIAAKEGNPKLAKLLIKKGVDVNIQDKNGKTLFQVAKERGNMEIIRILALQKRGKNKELLVAAEEVEFYMKTISQKEKNKRLFAAVKEGDLEGVKETIELGADVNAISDDKIQSTPLHEAASCGKKEVAELLLKYGANIESKDHFGRTPLHNASNLGHDAVVKLLLENDADVNAVTSDYSSCKETPLHKAITNSHLDNHLKVVKMLLDHRANTEIEDKGGDTPLDQAVICNRIKAIKLLLDARANVNTKNERGETLLHIAIYLGFQSNSKEKCDVVELLLNGGADIHAKDKNGNTPLDLAKKKGYKAMITLLEKAHEERNPRISQILSEEEEKIPLDVAKKSGDKEVVTLSEKEAQPPRNNFDEMAAVSSHSQGNSIS